MKSARPHLLRGAQIAILCALAALLWQAADGRAALAHLRSADPVWLIAAGLVLTVQTALSAQRWRVTAAQLGLTIELLPALREYYLAQVVNQSLPGGVLGDASRAVRSRKEAGLLVAAQAVLFERIAGQLGLIAVLVTGLAASILSPNVLDWPQWLSLSLGILALIAAALLGALTIWPRLRRTTVPFLNAVWAPNIRTQQIALSLGTALCNVAAFAFCALALDVAIPLVAIAALIPLILFAMVLPISIGGWGVREGAAALLFPVMGATAAQGLATSISFGLVFLAIILPGLFLGAFITFMRPNAPVPATPTQYLHTDRATHSARKDMT